MKSLSQISARTRDQDSQNASGASLPAAPPVPSMAQAFWYWLRLGFISFGGPAGQIALMHTELVERQRWISERRFLHALNYCMVLPGPEAQQLAIYLGWLMHRTRGGLVAGTLFVLPSLFLLIGLSWLYVRFGQLPAVAGVLYGVKPAVTAIVVSAAWRLGRRNVRNRWLLGIAALAFVAIYVLAVPFPVIVLSAGLMGYLGSRWMRDHFNHGAAHGAHSAAKVANLPAVWDDDTPTPAHALFTWRRFRQVLFVGLGVWALTAGALGWWCGFDAVATQMAWFFTKASLLTFGGAYAVLPYVQQGAVSHFHWLTAGQMIDGLALGETTPGPLIMVVTFVGFMGGWSQSLAAPETQLAGALLTALVATFFTFLPSFIFIFLGAPFIESTHGDLRFTAPLAGISAAVVGVIVNLAVLFAVHVLWPTGWSGPFEWPALLIGIAAAAVLVRQKAGVIPVVLASALAGVALSVVR